MFAFSRVRALLVSAIVVAYSLFSVGSSLGGFHWAAELLTHFRVQAAVAGVLIALLCASLRLRYHGAVACGLAALHLIPVLPYVVPGLPPPSVDLPRVRLLQVNVLTVNRDHQAVIDLVMDRNPDILALLEVNERWLDALTGLHARYPYRIEHPQNDNFGIALFSRFPLDDLHLRGLHHDSINMIVGNFSLGSTPVTLVVAHSVPPAGSAYSALRNEQLEELSEIARRSREREVILIGDLNTSPWSPFHRRLEESSGLRNGARGLGLFPTWPTGFRPLMIPLDHYLLSGGLRLVVLESGPEVGSDHLPVFAEVTVLAPGSPV